MAPRTLSKSDFKLARSCDAKLFFRENGYPDNRDMNPYLALLAEGGYMVEALAKAKYVDGVQLEYGRGVAEDYQRTIDQLGRDHVTLFEATLLVGRQQARVDILERKGNTVRLLEVKSKSFDGAEHILSLSAGRAGALRAVKKPFKIFAKWEEKLEDITFQVLLLEKVLPGVIIKPFLVLVDTSKTAGLDNIPSLFELVRRTSADGTSRLATARYIGSPEQLTALDLVTEVDVSEEVAMLHDDVEEAAPRRSSSHASTNPSPFIPSKSSAAPSVGAASSRSAKTSRRAASRNAGDRSLSRSPTCSSFFRSASAKGWTAPHSSTGCSAGRKRPYSISPRIVSS